MKNSTWSKVFGWFQFGIVTLGTFLGSGQTPHGWRDWVTLIASGAVAVATHKAASTDGTK